MVIGVRAPTLTLDTIKKSPVISVRSIEGVGIRYASKKNVLIINAATAAQSSASNHSLAHDLAFCLVSTCAVELDLRLDFLSDLSVLAKVG